MEKKMISQGLIMATVILLIRSTDSSHSARSCSTAMPAVTKVVNSLGSRLEELININDNYFISPLSITLALAMVYIGARGTTRGQMSQALQLDVIGKNSLPNKVSENFRDLIKSLVNDGEDYSFLIANGAFVQTGSKISPYYSQNLQRFFNTNIGYLNFASEEMATMEAINKWVANHTKNNIPKLLNEPLDPLTILVLVNAVYFKGLWNIPFNVSSTRKSLFYGMNGTRNVPFMTMQDKLHFYFDEETDYSFLELEYIGGNMNMIIILPNKKNEIPDYILTSELLCFLRGMFEEKNVTVQLPRFSMEYKRELSKDMVKLGMAELFSDRADLSGIQEQNDLHVSLMMHKAVIEVNEEGSRASGVSGIGIDGRKPFSQVETFVADHPFSFYIVDRHTDTVLFSGRVMNL